MRIYWRCCGYGALWRSHMFWYLMLFIALAMTTIFWLASLDKKEVVNVYVVEEHHEALKYWHHATVINKMNRTGNTLIHIDGHSDMATPRYFPDVPFFKWPVEKRQLNSLIQRNDVFIQGAIIIGMLDHVMWIYPSWDKNVGFGEYDLFLFEIGIIRRRNHEEKNAIFCECHTPINKYTHQVFDETKAECSYLDETKSVIDEKINKEDCQIKKKLLFEVIVDELALEMFEKSAWAHKSSNVILDIDEDYFGCERGGTPLEKVSIPWSAVERLNLLANDLICAKNTFYEEAGDKVMKELIGKFIEICQLTRATTCKISSPVITDRLKEPIFHQYNFMPRLFCHDKSISVVLLQRTVEVLKRFSYDQLVALAKLGYCLNTTPATLGFHDDVAEFKICHGANTLNETIVSIHTPDQDEVKRRMLLLQSILKHVTDMKPNIVTLCRSVRDGYTPRHLVEQIEGGIMNFFAQNHENIKFNVIYDDNLLGGIQGWQGRYKVNIK